MYVLIDADKSLNHIKVDMKQALLKLGEIPLLDYYIDIYKNYLKNLWAKVIYYFKHSLTRIYTHTLHFSR